MFRGSLVALVTPFTATGNVDFSSFEKLLLWHLQSDTNGIVVLGTTGESATITGKERDDLIKLAVATVNKKIPIIAGVGTNCTRTTIDLAERAMALGADAGLVVCPYYNKPNQEGLYEHFKTLAAAVPLPLILYNVPTRTGCDLLPDTVVRLATIPNIVAIKEAVADLQRIENLVTKLADSMDVLSGDDPTALQAMRLGAKGVISVTANILPQQVAIYCAAALRNQWQQATALNERLAVLHKKLFLAPNPVPTKALLARSGKIAAYVRLPLTPLTVTQEEELFAIWDEVNTIA